MKLRKGSKVKVYGHGEIIKEGNRKHRWPPGSYPFFNGHLAKVTEVNRYDLIEVTLLEVDLPDPARSSLMAGSIVGVHKKQLRKCK